VGHLRRFQWYLCSRRRYKNSRCHE